MTLWLLTLTLVSADHNVTKYVTLSAIHSKALCTLEARDMNRRAPALYSDTRFTITHAECVREYRP